MKRRRLPVWNKPIRTYQIHWADSNGFGTVMGLAGTPAEFGEVYLSQALSALEKKHIGRIYCSICIRSEFLPNINGTNIKAVMRGNWLLLQD